MAREYCYTCELAKVACVCSVSIQQKNALPVVIIRHPDETSKPMGTAKLARLGLEKIILYTGTSFEEASFLEQVADLGVNNPILLYEPSRQQSAGFTIDVENSQKGLRENICGHDAVIVLDGTWRNTRELLLANRWLQFLPRLTLRGVPESRYRIRKADQLDALSTIEAVACVLDLVEPDFSKADFLRPFEEMVDFQIASMGQEVFAKNYG